MLDMDIFPQIPGYRIEKKLGDSSISDVYLAVQEDLDRQVAIKVLNPKLFKEKDVVERFLREARKAAQFVHPNIVNILEVGENEDFHYIVMEHLPDSLRNRINRQFGLSDATPGPALEGPEVMNVLKQLAWALDYAHKEGVVHRNIRPENIRFREDNAPVVVDFFVSRVLGAEDSLKKQGIIFGSPHYGSPERALGKRLDGSSDIYSLGIVLFEMLMGRVPFDGDEAIAVENKHIMEPVPQLPGYLAAYQGLIDRMLAKNKEDRVPSGAELVQVIDQVNFKLHGGEQPGKPQAQPPQEYGNLPDLDFSGAVEDKKEEKRSKKNKKEKVKKERVKKEKVKQEKKNDEVPSIDEFPELSPEDIPGRPQKPPAAIPRRKKPLINFSFNPKLLIPVVAGIVIIAGVYFFMSGSSGDDADFSYGKPKQTKQAQPEKKQEETRPLTEEEKQELAIKKKKFDYKFNMAKRDFKAGRLGNAEKRLKEAQAILDAPEGKKLAKEIAAKKKEKVEDDAYAAAVKAKTEEALEEFMKKFPGGRHKAKAEQALAQLRTELEEKREKQRRILANRVKLRTEYQDVTIPQVKEMTKKYGFYEKYYNNKGDFKNNYELRVFDTDKVVVDNATGLMWYHGGSERDLILPVARTWVQQVNQDKYAGFSDWRLPTLEEALSLLEPEERQDALFIDPVFNLDIKFIWTGDSFDKTKNWVVDFFGGDTARVGGRIKAYIRPVRSFVNDKQ